MLGTPVQGAMCKCMGGYQKREGNKCRGKQNKKANTRNKRGREGGKRKRKESEGRMRERRKRERERERERERAPLPAAVRCVHRRVTWPVTRARGEGGGG